MTTKLPPKQPLSNGYISKGGHDTYDAHDNFQSPHSYMNHAPKAFQVRVHVNNDKFEPGKKMTVASNKIKTFENFLQECTERLKPPFGAARRLYTARGRHRVQKLDELTEDSIYVITGYEKYKAQNYREISYQSKVPRRKGFKKIDGDRIYTPVVHATEERLRNQVGRAYYLAEHRRGLRLRVHVNGMEERPSCLVKVQYNDRDNYTRILAEIEAAMSLQPIQRVYKVNNLGGISENFSEIRDAGQLENNDHILVLPRNKCSNLQCKVYALEGMDRFKVSTSPRAGTYHMYPSFKDGWTNKHDRNLNKHKLLPSIGSSSKKSDSMSPFSNTPGSQRGGGGRNNVRSKGAGEVDYDRDDGLYRAKRQNNPHRAQQVNESRETRTEKPIDQMKAEIVEEEEISNKEQTTPIPADTEPAKETKQNEQNASETKKRTEVKKDGKTGKEVNKITELPPIVNRKERGSSKVRKDSSPGKGDIDEIQKGFVNESVNKLEENIGGGDPFVDEKDAIPVDLKTDEVLDMAERQSIPIELKTNDVEVNQPPRSTSPPEVNVSRGSDKIQDQDENVVMNRIDEYEDDSFNQDDRITPGAVSKDPRSSTPASRDEAKRKLEQKEHEAATKIQAGFHGYNARRRYKAKKDAVKQEREDESRRRDDAQSQDDDARHMEIEAQEQAKKKRMNEDLAATKIQAAVRGHNTRKGYKYKKGQK